MHPLAAITPTTVGDVTRTGLLHLLASAGGLVLRVSRGPESLHRLLSLVVILRGLEIPVAALQTANVMSGAVICGRVHSSFQEQETQVNRV